MKSLSFIFILSFQTVLFGNDEPLKKSFLQAVQNNDEQQLIKVLNNNIKKKTITEGLVLSCKKGKLDMVEQLLISCPENINATNKNGSSIFAIACINNHSEICDYLSKLRRFNINQKHPEYGSILADIIVNKVNNDSEKTNSVIKRLLSYYKYLNIDQRNKEGKTPLIFAVLHSTPDIVSTLVKFSADVNAYDFAKHTPLYYAILLEDSDDAFEKTKILLKNGADANKKCNKLNKWSPLSLAIGENKLKIAIALIKNGADVDIKTYRGITPIMVATGQKNIELVKALLDKKCNLNLKDDKGYTCLDTLLLMTDILEDKKKELGEYQEYAVEEELNGVKEKLKKNKQIINLLRKHGAKTAKELEEEEDQPK